MMAGMLVTTAYYIIGKTGDEQCKYRFHIRVQCK